MRQCIPVFALLAISPTTMAKAQTTAYLYDALGRLSNVNETGGSAPINTTYQYDAAGNRAQVTVSLPAPQAARASAPTHTMNSIPDKARNQGR
jgi:uncharacterized protein RhaS with RHS repeats